MTSPYLDVAFPPCECARCRPAREREAREAEADLARWRGERGQDVASADRQADSPGQRGQVADRPTSD